MDQMPEARRRRNRNRSSLFACKRSLSKPCAPVSLAIGVLWQVFYPPGELFNGGLAIDPGRIEGSMPEQCGQSVHIAGILGQVIAWVGLPQRMSTRVIRH